MNHTPGLHGSMGIELNRSNCYTFTLDDFELKKSQNQILTLSLKWGSFMPFGKIDCVPVSTRSNHNHYFFSLKRQLEEMRNDKESLMGIIAGYDISITIKRIIVGLITKTSPRGFKIFKEFSWTETLKTGFFKNVTCFTDLTVSRNKKSVGHCTVLTVNSA